jgi:hypothetical protein
LKYLRPGSYPGFIFVFAALAVIPKRLDFRVCILRSEDYNGQLLRGDGNGRFTYWYGHVKLAFVDGRIA